MASRDSPSGSGLESGALSSLVKLSRYPFSDEVVVGVGFVDVDVDEARPLFRRKGDGPTNAMTFSVELMIPNTAPASERVAYFDM